jgi:hypothetical protein
MVIIPSPFSNTPCHPFHRAWPKHVFGGYDAPNIVNRISPAQACIAILLLISPSTSTLYSETALPENKGATERSCPLCLSGP